jgi:hypothetical protein
MGRSKKVEMPRDLAALRRNIDRWRKAQNGVRRRIPEEIWSCALALLEKHTVVQIADAVGLPYESFRKRARLMSTDKSRAARRSTAVKTKFVEIPIKAREPSMTILELRSPNGSSAIVRTDASSAADIIARIWAGRE